MKKLVLCSNRISHHIFQCVRTTLIQDYPRNKLGIKVVVDSLSTKTMTCQKRQSAVNFQQLPPAKTIIPLSPLYQYYISVITPFPCISIISTITHTHTISDVIQSICLILIYSLSRLSRLTTLWVQIHIGSKMRKRKKRKFHNIIKQLS